MKIRKKSIYVDIGLNLSGITSITLFEGPKICTSSLELNFSINVQEYLLKFQQIQNASFDYKAKGILIKQK